MNEITEKPWYARLIDKIHSLMAGRTKPLLIALDGRSGVGKTTLAQAIAQELRGIVIGGDDFFSGGSDSDWDARSAEAKVADCIDWRRLRKEALEPLLSPLKSRGSCKNFKGKRSTSHETIKIHRRTNHLV